MTECTLTLLALSTSTVIGIDSCFAKPLCGRQATMVRGPLAQQRQQKFLFFSIFTGDCGKNKEYM